MYNQNVTIPNSFENPYLQNRIFQTDHFRNYIRKPASANLCNRILLTLFILFLVLVAISGIVIGVYFGLKNLNNDNTIIFNSTQASIIQNSTLKDLSSYTYSTSSLSTTIPSSTSTSTTSTSTSTTSTTSTSTSTTSTTSTSTSSTTSVNSTSTTLASSSDTSSSRSSSSTTASTLSSTTFSTTLTSTISFLSSSFSSLTSSILSSMTSISTSTPLITTIQSTIPSCQNFGSYNNDTKICDCIFFITSGNYCEIISKYIKPMNNF